jgi:hypothetical protein
MKSLDRQSLEEQTRLVSRYVAGDLSRSERAEFEAWLVASPDLAAEVEMERRLRRGIASAARRGWLKRGTGAPVAVDRRWRLALAASVLVSLAVGMSLLLPRPGVESPTVIQARAKPVLPSRTVRLGSVRGVGSSPDILLARAEAPGQLVIEPDVVVLTCEDRSIEIECAGGSAPRTPQYAEYELDLVKRADGNLAWRSPRQMPLDGLPLSFALRDPGAIAAGDYDLIVRGHSADHEEVVGRFWLRIH